MHVDTRFSRLLGKPHLMVAGMTPCTVDERFVSAIINAGYHVELAGGGQHTEVHLRNRVSKIMEMVAPGEGITLNVLFLNPRLWGFQYPATMAMRKEGIPMEGLCIAAGVPSLDVADEVLKNLKEAGIKHVAFKPGSIETIRRVIAIAKKHPDMPVILQWTGGRGGGHHSFEVNQFVENYSSMAGKYIEKANFFHPIGYASTFVGNVWIYPTCSKYLLGGRKWIWRRRGNLQIP